MMKINKNIFLILISFFIIQQSFAQTNVPPIGVQSIILDNNDNEYLTKKDFELYTQNVRKGGKLIGIGGGMILSSAIMYTIGFTGLGNSNRSSAPIFLVAIGSFTTFTGFALITAGGVKIAKSPVLKNRKESAKLHYQLSPANTGIALRF